MLYPINTETRKVYDLNGIWKFNFENEKKQLIAVPASFNEQLVGHNNKHYVGKMFYERKILIRREDLNKRIFIRFGSISHIANVYINNNKVGYHKGGFTPFEFEITNFIEEGENKLLVEVSNILDYTSLPVGNYTEKFGVKKVDENFDFFNYSGIHRPVKLCIRNNNFIKDIYISYSLDKDNADIQFKILVDGKYSKAKVTIIDEEDNLLESKEGYENIEVILSNIRRWEVLDAYLYKAKVEIYNENNELEDIYIEEFGLRSIKIENNQFLINDKPFYFKGFGKHEDIFINGRGLNEPLNIRDINMMKWIGANSFRTSHYPYSEEMMRLADREGFVIIDETTAVGLMESFGFDLLSNKDKKNTWEVMNTTEAHKQVIEELITRDKNHACVVMWSIANEPSSAETGAYEYFKPLFELAKSLDPQKRPCTFVNIGLTNPNNCLVSPLCDVICLNRYYGWYSQISDLKLASKLMKDELELWHKKYPNVPIMYTEYGADTVAGFHDMDELSPFTEEFQVKYYKAYEEVFDQLPYFIGEQTWNFADFETKFGIFRVQGNKKGVFTRDRKPKSVAHHLKTRWSSIPNYYYKGEKNNE